MCTQALNPISFSKWKWPNVPNLNSFGGDLIHTARWPKDFDYDGKVVAVIGNGASGIQLLPEIQPGELPPSNPSWPFEVDVREGVRKLYHIIRTPTWIIPPWIQTMMLLGKVGNALSNLEMDEQLNFSAVTIEKFKSDPEFYRAFVKAIERGINGTFPVVSLQAAFPASAGG